MLLAEHCEPETYQDALSSECSKEWLGAMKEEISSLQENHTWELVDLPLEEKLLDVVGFSELRIILVKQFNGLKPNLWSRVSVRNQALIFHRLSVQSYAGILSELF